MDVSFYLDREFHFGSEESRHRRADHCQSRFVMKIIGIQGPSNQYSTYESMSLNSLLIQLLCKHYAGPGRDVHLRNIRLKNASNEI